MYQRHRTLAVRMAGMVLAALLPLGLLSLYQSHAILRQSLVLNLQSQIESANQTAHLALASLETAQNAAKFLATSLALPALGDLKTCQALLHSISQGRMRGALAAFVPLSGVSRCTSNGQSLDLSQMKTFPIWRDARESHIYTQETWPSLPDRGLILFTHPVFNTEQQLLGQLIFVWPFDLLLNSSRPDHPEIDQKLYTLDAAGKIAAWQALESESFGVAASPYTAIAEDNSLITTFQLSVDVNFLIKRPLQQPLATWSESLIFLTPILIWLSGGVVSLWGSQILVTRHIRKLNQAMTEFQNGQRDGIDLTFSHAAQEIQSLADSYQKMVAQIVTDESQLTTLISEKNKLLEEVHHRTGNSLQLLASVIRMHLREDPAPETRTILNDLHNRVMSLASVHIGLYRTSGQNEIMVDALLAEVIAKIRFIYGSGAPRSRTDSQLAPLRLSAAQAVPLALFLAEVLATFPLSEADLGQIKIRLTAQNQTQGILTITGPARAKALLDGERPGAPARIAAKLIRAFAEQLNAEYDVIDLEQDRIEVRLIFNKI